MRRNQEMAEWNPLIDPLASAFLTWKYGKPPVKEKSGHPEQAPTSTPSDSHEAPNAVPDIDCTVAVYDIFSMKSSVTIMRPSTSTSIPVDLAAHGYLAKTPLFPTVAVGFQTMEHFHRLRLRQASLSIEAFTKVICDHYQVCRILADLKHTNILFMFRSPTDDTSELFLRRHMRFSCVSSES